MGCKYRKRCKLYSDHLRSDTQNVEVKICTWEDEACPFRGYFERKRRKKMAWPIQKECDVFYGNPRKPHFTDNLVGVKFPWLCVTSWDNKPYSRIQVHKLCAESLTRVLAAIWEAAGHSQDKINEWGMNKCGGGYNYRVMRGGNTLSMHAYGCAVDFDPVRNSLGDATPYLANCPEVLQAFAAEGWRWGGDWHRPDGMHFQAARVS